MTMLVGTRRALLGAGRRLKYLLRATFNAADQGYADAQVLDTRAEGIQDGTLTVVEVDGTLAIVSNQMAFTAQGTPTWGDLGFASQAITKALGRALIATVNLGETNKEGFPVAWHDSSTLPAGLADRMYNSFWSATGTLVFYVYNGAGAALENPTVGSYSATTDYQAAIVLGGYDTNGLPYYAGQTKANYDYGCWFLIKGGAFTTWSLLWSTAGYNVATLYAVTMNSNHTGTLDDFRVPDKDLSAIQVPVAYSSFTAANGTSLDAITPEVGGAWTERTGNFDIQTNRANISVASGGRDVATVAAGIDDVIADVTIRKTDANDTGEMGLCLRYSDDANFWMVHGDLAANQIEIVERNATVETQRASAAIALVVATDYAVRAIAYGQTIDAFLDGANRITYGVAALNENATIHGIMGDGVAETMDGFAVYPRTSAQYDAVLGGV